MSKQDISNEAILNLAAQLDREVVTQFLADKFRALLADRERLRGERDAARETLREALDDVPGWVETAAALLRKHDA